MCTIQERFSILELHDATPRKREAIGAPLKYMLNEAMNRNSIQ